MRERRRKYVLNVPNMSCFISRANNVCSVIYSLFQPLYNGNLFTVTTATKARCNCQLTNEWMVLQPRKKKIILHPKLSIRVISITWPLFLCLQDSHCGQVHLLLVYTFSEFYPKPKLFLYSISGPKYEFKHLRGFHRHSSNNGKNYVTT